MAEGSNKKLQEPIHDYWSQELTAGAMMWLQEQDVRSGVEMWLQEQTFKSSSSHFCRAFSFFSDTRSFGAALLCILFAKSNFFSSFSLGRVFAFFPKVETKVLQTI